MIPENPTPAEALAETSPDQWPKNLKGYLRDTIFEKKLLGLVVTMPPPPLPPWVGLETLRRQHNMLGLLTVVEKAIRLRIDQGDIDWAEQTAQENFALALEKARKRNGRRAFTK